jgi:uncharacterized membrane protein required for colicin V production
MVPGGPATKEKTMTLTVVLLATVAVLALVGLMRGVRRGLLALAGTLFAAVLVDLWNERLVEWLRSTLRPEQPALPIFLLTASLFLFTALIVGYGGSALLPRPDPQAKQTAAIVDRPLGALLGALNGALIGSYLLRYADEIWVDGSVGERAMADPVALVLERWLPWFVMAMVGATTIFVLLRLTTTFLRGRAAATAAAARRSPAAQPAQPAAPRPAATQPAQPSQPAPPAQATPPPPRSVGEMDRRVNDKINQATGKK